MTLAFSGRLRVKIQLFKTFETGFERKPDAKMKNFIGILSIPATLFASNNLSLNLLNQGLLYQ